MGFGFTGLGTAKGAGQGLRNLIAQRMVQARFEQEAAAEIENQKLRAQQIQLGQSQLEGLNEDRASLRQVRMDQLGRAQREDEQLQALMSDPNLRPEVAEYLKLRSAGVDGSAPAGLFAKPGASGSNTPEEMYLLGLEKDLGRSLTAQERLDARKKWGASDNAPQRPWAPIIVAGIGSGGGSGIVDRSTGRVRDITPPDANPGDRVIGPPDSAAARAARAQITALTPFVDKVAARALSLNAGTPGGLKGRVQGGVRSMKGSVGLDDDAALYNESIAAFAGQLSRLGGEVGVLTDQDIQRAIGMAPKIGMSEKLTQQKIADLQDFLAAKFAAYERKMGGVQVPGAGAGAGTGSGSGSPVRWGKGPDGKPMRLP